MHNNDEKHTWSSSSDTFKASQKYKTLLESESKGEKIKYSRTERDGKFTFKEFSNWYEEQDIQRQLTTPHMPQQNGVIGRKNRTIVGLTKSMLKDKSLSLELWVDAMRCVVEEAFKIFGSIVHVKTPEALALIYLE